MPGSDFDIIRPETWIASSDNPISWEGVPLYKVDGGPLSEKDMVDFFEAAFAFLEQKGDHISYEQQQKSVQTVLNRMKNTNSKEAIDKKIMEEQEKRNNAGRIKVLIRCNYYREERHFNGTCWKCDYPIPQNFSNCYQCPHCGFITFHDGDKYLDEWEHWDLDEAKVPVSSAHEFIRYLGDHLGDHYYQLEDSCSGLPNFSKINIMFASLIESMNNLEHIDYQELATAYFEYATFLFENEGYFYEALYNSQLCKLLYLKEFGVKKVKAVCHMPCQKKCTDFPSCDIDETIRHQIFPKRDALDMGFFDYDDPEEAISRGYIIGYCHGEYEQNITSPLYDAAMAKLARQRKAWGKAVEQAEKEFNTRGIKKPSDETPGYLERINEIYRENINSLIVP